MEQTKLSDTVGAPYVGAVRSITIQVQPFSLTLSEKIKSIFQVLFSRVRLYQHTRLQSLDSLPHSVDGNGGRHEERVASLVVVFAVAESTEDVPLGLKYSGAGKEIHSPFHCEHPSEI